MICKRCQSIMYPYRKPHAENHKPGYCSDGGPVKDLLDPMTRDRARDKMATDLLPWPLPEGIFSNGSTFHPIPFLQNMRVLYQQFIEEQTPYENLDLEIQIFLQLYVRQAAYINRNCLFKLVNSKVGLLGSEFIVEYDGQKYLRIDCLRDDDTE